MYVHHEAGALLTHWSHFSRDGMTRSSSQFQHERSGIPEILIEAWAVKALSALCQIALQGCCVSLPVCQTVKPHFSSFPEPTWFLLVDSGKEPLSPLTPYMMIVIVIINNNPSTIWLGSLTPMQCVTGREKMCLPPPPPSAMGGLSKHIN